MAYRYCPMTLAAGETRPLNQFGRYCRVLYNSIATDPMIRIGGEPEQVIPAGVGVDLYDGIDPTQNFDQVTVRNPAGVAMDLVIGVSNAQIADSRLYLIGSTVFSDILDQLKGGVAALNWGLVTVAGAATSIAASNTSRRSIMITALAANTGVIYIGYDNTVSNSKYIIALNAGDSWGADDYQGAVYGLAAVANEKVSLSEV